MLVRVFLLVTVVQSAVLVPVENVCVVSDVRNSTRLHRLVENNG